MLQALELMLQDLVQMLQGLVLLLQDLQHKIPLREKTFLSRGKQKFL